MAKSNITKKAIVSALKELMKKKPVQKISIRELTENADINRQTFYYHFNDIYDCIQWMYQEEALSSLKKSADAKKWQDGLLELFNYIDANKEVAMCTLNSLGRNSLKDFFVDDINSICSSFIEEFKQATGSADIMEKNRDYIEFILKFYTISLSSIIESYLTGELDQTPQELIKLIGTSIEDHLSGACSRLNIETSNISALS